MFVGIVDAFRSMIGAFSFDISPVSYDACLFFMILLPIYDTSMVSGSAFIPLQSSHLFVPLHHNFKIT